MHISKGDPDLLAVWYRYAGNSCHYLTLPLLMLRFILINDIKPPLAADYLVIRTDLLDTGTHFHADLLLLWLQRRTAS